MKTSRILAALAAACVLCLIAPGTASARHVQRKPDANDTPGKLDAEQWSMRVKRGKATCKAHFFGQVEATDLGPPSSGLLCGLDYKGTGGEEDAFVHMYHDGSQLVAEFSRRNSGGTFDYIKNLSRRGVNTEADTAWVKIPRRLMLGSRNGYLKWRQRTIYEGPPCGPGVDACDDFGPDDHSWYRYNYG